MKTEKKFKMKTRKQKLEKLLQIDEAVSMFKEKKKSALHSVKFYEQLGLNDLAKDYKHDVSILQMAINRMEKMYEKLKKEL